MRQRTPRGEVVPQPVANEGPSQADTPTPTNGAAGGDDPHSADHLPGDAVAEERPHTAYHRKGCMQWNHHGDAMAAALPHDEDAPCQPHAADLPAPPPDDSVAERRLEARKASFTTTGGTTAAGTSPFTGGAIACHELHTPVETQCSRKTDPRADAQPQYPHAELPTPVETQCSRTTGPQADAQPQHPHAYPTHIAPGPPYTHAVAYTADGRPVHHRPHTSAGVTAYHTPITQEEMAHPSDAWPSLAASHERLPPLIRPVPIYTPSDQYDSPRSECDSDASGEWTPGTFNTLAHMGVIQLPGPPFHAVVPYA